MGSGTLRKVWRYARWLLLVLIIVYIALVALGSWHLSVTKKTADAIAYIQSRHISPEDVDGKHLPPSPDKTQNNATVAGIDANQNGIRDDVELAIFAKYPNNRALRAAALQYAMTEQLFLTSVFNKETWKAVAEENGRANLCLTSQDLGFKQIEDLSKWIEDQVLNNPERSSTYEQIFGFTTSHGDGVGRECDVED